MISLKKALRRPASTLRHCGVALCTTFLLFSACAELPQNVERPVSAALASPAGTPLSNLVQQRRQAAAAGAESGFILLDGAPAAYGSRLALAEGAQKTLDLQYYAIHADASTSRLLAAVRDAARRGVRVRILLDDFHSTGQNALVMRLAFVPNIEMRMFNPVPGSRRSSFARLLNVIDDASRIQQRMHNKLFIADNVLGVTGGRNLGDAYFGNSEASNFVDMDVLAAGPIVRDLSRSFDTYWNDERAYPVQSLVTREELESLRDEAGAEAPKSGGGSPRAPDGEPRPRGTTPAAPQRDRSWDQKPMDLRTANFVWAPAAVLVDKPAKIPADTPRGTPAAPKAPGLVVTQQGRRPPAPASGGTLEAAADAAANGETVVEGLLQLVGQAQRELLIISPYFVPGQDMKQAFAAALARGVKIRVLTNSLASNDAPAAHVGYARHREELLDMGIELYEMRSEQADSVGAFGSEGGGSTAGESHSMLHSKVLVMDGRLLVVGSMNLDLRSQLQNTEIALLIRSNELCRVAAGQIEAAMRLGAWRLDRADGRLVWRAPQRSGLKDSTSEPDAGIGLRLLLKLLGPFAPDRLL